MGEFEIRSFRASKDLPATKRIWRECGWVTENSHEKYIDDFYASGQGFVATLDDVAECVGHYVPAKMRYGNVLLEMAAVTSIVTSAIARRRGLAKAITSRVVAAAAEQGAHVAMLGMFEQGFYDQMGFGTGAYESLFAFDPSNLKDLGEHRIPRRLTSADSELIHTAMTRRWLGHGGCVLDEASHTKACLHWIENGWGLGYENDEGELTHFFFGKLKGEHGPLGIHRIGYQNAAQLRELFSLIRSVADQVSQVKILEPAHLQLQDVLAQPFRSWRISKGSQQESNVRTEAFWQARILDLERCIAKTQWNGPSLRFNLELSDPIEQYLHSRGDAPRSESKWRGVGGQYVIELGDESSALPGTDAHLPTLSASVNAFTRMWLGVRSATELAISDQLVGSRELLESLDETLRVPTPRLGWYF